MKSASVVDLSIATMMLELPSSDDGEMPTGAVVNWEESQRPEELFGEGLTLLRRGPKLKPSWQRAARNPSFTP